MAGTKGTVGQWWGQWDNTVGQRRGTVVGTVGTVVGTVETQWWEQRDRCGDCGTVVGTVGQ
eukprot:773442-Pyramimonas_sp.AAC.1